MICIYCPPKDARIVALEEALERSRQAIEDWEAWVADQDEVPPDDLLRWSRLALEELAALAGEKADKRLDNSPAQS